MKARVHNRLHCYYRLVGGGEEIVNAVYFKLGELFYLFDYGPIYS